jgi:hypothetical protein
MCLPAIVRVSPWTESTGTVFPILVGVLQERLSPADCFALGVAKRICNFFAVCISFGEAKRAVLRRRWTSSRERIAGSMRSMLTSSMMALSACRKPASMSVRWKDSGTPLRGGPSWATAGTSGDGCGCCGNGIRSLRRRGLPGRATPWTPDVLEGAARSSPTCCFGVLVQEQDTERVFRLLLISRHRPLQNQARRSRLGSLM